MTDADGGTRVAGADQPALRVKPSALIGYGIAVGYIVLFALLEMLIAPAYTEIGKTSGSVLNGIVIPLAICGVIMALLTTLLGWWRPALREKPLGAKWMWAIPVLLVLIVLSGVNYSQLGALGGPYLMWLAIGTLLVGFNEEITYRGLSVVAFRSAYKEVWVWLLTSLFFGLLHGANVVLGQDVVTTIRQIVFAFVLGSVFYVARRVTGSLVFLMIIHALWDFGSFTWVRGLEATGVNATNILVAARFPLLIALLVMSAIGAKKLFATPVEQAG